MNRRAKLEEGSTTVLAAGIIIVLVAIMVLGVSVMALHAQKTFSQAVADLSALAGAATSPSSLLDVSGGAAGACSAARSVAERNGLELTSCRPEGQDLRVIVHKRVSVPFLAGAAISAKARAGPDFPD